MNKHKLIHTVFGSPNWARTSDIMINSHALYRLSYGGISRGVAAQVSSA